MTTIVLQIVDVALLFLFGLLGLRIASVLREVPMQAAPWGFVGTTFAVVYLNGVLMNLFAAVAFASGPGSTAWNAFLAWAPLANHSRTLGLLVAFTSMGFHFVLPRPTAYAPEPRAQPVRAGVAVVGGMLLGAALGWVQDLPMAAAHFASVVLLDTAEMLVLLVVLFGLLLRDRTDRHLWFALSVFALNLCMNVGWLSAMMGFGVPNGWRISPPVLHAGRTVLALGMVYFAARRLYLARRGVMVAGLVRPPRRPDLYLPAEAP